MARPTTSPRLASLNPHEIGATVDQRTDAALERMIGVHLFDSSVELCTLDGKPVSVALRRTRTSDLAMTAEALTTYAQRGLPVWDWETHEEPRDALMELVTRLYSRPVDALADVSEHIGPLSDPDEDLDLEDPVALVIVAVQARLDLADGNAVSARDLAALASLHPDAVRRLARDGELTLSGTRPARASAEEARRWLGSRGIKGL